MGIIGTLILGFVIGVIAKSISKGPEPGGFIGTIVIGVLGALVGSYIATLFNSEISFPPDRFFSLTVWVYSIVGALLVLFAYRLILRGSKG